MTLSRAMIATFIAITSLAACVHGTNTTGETGHHSKYAGQQHREVKSLSNDDLDELRRGGGWGLAKAAELNGLPGPVHVLDLSDELKLNTTQVAAMRAIFQKMQSEAIGHGRRLIALEKSLEEQFQKRSIDADQLKVILSKIGKTRADLRFVHLSAHLETPEILSAQQISQYNKLRGYGDGDICAKVPAGHHAALWRRHNGCS